MYTKMKLKPERFSEQFTVPVSPLNISIILQRDYLRCWYESVRQDENWMRFRKQVDDEQFHVYIKWINLQFSRLLYGKSDSGALMTQAQSLYAWLEVRDLGQDLADGLRFIYLIEIIYDCKLTKEFGVKKLGCLKLHKVKNHDTCLNYLQHNAKIKCVGINPSDLAEGNIKMITGLLFLIKHDFETKISSLSFGDATKLLSASCVEQTPLCLEQNSKELLKSKSFSHLPHKETTKQVIQFPDINEIKAEVSTDINCDLGDIVVHVTQENEIKHEYAIEKVNKYMPEKRPIGDDAKSILVNYLQLENDLDDKINATLDQILINNLNITNKIKTKVRDTIDVSNESVNNKKFVSSVIMEQKLLKATLFELDKYPEIGIENENYFYERECINDTLVNDYNYVDNENVLLSDSSDNVKSKHSSLLTDSDLSSLSNSSLENLSFLNRSDESDLRKSLSPAQYSNDELVGLANHAIMTRSIQENAESDLDQDKILNNELGLEENKSQTSSNLIEEIVEISKQQDKNVSDVKLCIENLLTNINESAQILENLSKDDHRSSKNQQFDSQNENNLKNSDLETINNLNNLVFETVNIKEIENHCNNGSVDAPRELEDQFEINDSEENKDSTTEMNHSENEIYYTKNSEIYENPIDDSILETPNIIVNIDKPEIMEETDSVEASFKFNISDLIENKNLLSDSNSKIQTPSDYDQFIENSYVYEPIITVENLLDNVNVLNEIENYENMIDQNDSMLQLDEVSNFETCNENNENPIEINEYLILHSNETHVKSESTNEKCINQVSSKTALGDIEYLELVEENYLSNITENLKNIIDDMIFETEKFLTNEIKKETENQLVISVDTLVNKFEINNSNKYLANETNENIKTPSERDDIFTSTNDFENQLETNSENDEKLNSFSMSEIIITNHNQNENLEVDNCLENQSEKIEDISKFFSTENDIKNKIEVTEKTDSINFSDELKENNDSTSVEVKKNQRTQIQSNLTNTNDDLIAETALSIETDFGKKNDPIENLSENTESISNESKMTSAENEITNIVKIIKETDTTNESEEQLKSSPCSFSITEIITANLDQKENLVVDNCVQNLSENTENITSAENKIEFTKTESNIGIIEETDSINVTEETEKQFEVNELKENIDLPIKVEANQITQTQSDSTDFEVKDLKVECLLTNETDLVENENLNDLVENKSEKFENTKESEMANAENKLIAPETDMINKIETIRETDSTNVPDRSDEKFEVNEMKENNDLLTEVEAYQIIQTKSYSTNSNNDLIVETAISIETDLKSTNIVENVLKTNKDTKDISNEMEVEAINSDKLIPTAEIKEEIKNHIENKIDILKENDGLPCKTIHTPKESVDFNLNDNDTEICDSKSEAASNIVQESTYIKPPIKCSKKTKKIIKSKSKSSFQSEQVSSKQENLKKIAESIQKSWCYINLNQIIFSNLNFL